MPGQCGLAAFPLDAAVVAGLQIQIRRGPEMLARGLRAGTPPRRTVDDKRNIRCVQNWDRRHREMKGCPGDNSSCWWEPPVPPLQAGSRQGGLSVGSIAITEVKPGEDVFAYISRVEEVSIKHSTSR